MSETPASPTEYLVIYSGRVLEVLQARLANMSDAIKILEIELALSILDERLRIFPQFGQPLRNLNLPPLQIWIACVPPLVAHYVLDEERKTVSVVVPLTFLPIRKVYRREDTRLRRKPPHSSFAKLHSI